MHNVVSFLYYTAGSCIFNDDLDSILYVPLLIVYSVGSGVVSPKLCNFGNLKLRWRLHQSQNRFWLGVMDPPNGNATQHMAHTTYCPKRWLPPRYVMPLQGHNFVSIAHRNSRKVPMQHQHSRATLKSYLNARNIMAIEL